MAFRLSRRDLAKKAGVKPSFITDIAKGRRPVSEKVVQGIEDSLGVSAAWLRDGIEPMLIPDKDHSPDMVRTLHAYLGGPSTAPQRPDVPSLPVFERPVDGDIRVCLHKSHGWRRSVKADAWWSTRYFLQVADDLPRPEDIRAGDLLIVESRPTPWGGKPIKCLCVIRVSKEVQLAWVTARGFKDDSVIVVSPFEYPKPLSPLTSGRSRSLRLLGLVLGIERDTPDPTVEAALAIVAAESFDIID